MKQPLFIIGTQRSGSNLLRLILNQTGKIAAPHPPHILQTFIPLLKFYGNLENLSAFRKLITDVLLFIEYNPVKWDVKSFSTDIVLKECKHNSIYEIYRVVYELYAKEHQCSIWCCKSMANHKYIETMENVFTHPIYIYLVRDGRDVACSFKKAGVGNKHIYYLARDWYKDQLSCIVKTAKLPSDRVYYIQYEQLIANPEHALSALLNRLGIVWNDTFLNYYKSSEAVSTSKAGTMWQNVQSPIIVSNYNKYLNTLTSREIDIFESVAGCVLEYFGYELHGEHSRSGKHLSISTADIKSFNRENVLLKKLFFEQNQNEAILRLKQEQLINTIKSYII